MRRVDFLSKYEEPIVKEEPVDEKVANTKETDALAELEWAIQRSRRSLTADTINDSIHFAQSLTTNYFSNTTDPISYNRTNGIRENEDIQQDDSRMDPYSSFLRSQS